MKQDDHQISLLLKADAEELSRLASLPTAQTILWRGKIRAAWKRRQRVARLVALLEILGASALVLVIVGQLWTTLLQTPASTHPITVAVMGVLTLVAISVCAAASLVTSSNGMNR